MEQNSYTNIMFMSKLVERTVAPWLIGYRNKHGLLPQ